jgi:hypothetical protein
MYCDFLLHFDYIFLFYFAKTEHEKRADASVSHGRVFQSGRGSVGGGAQGLVTK